LNLPPIRRHEEVSMRKQFLSRVVLASAIVVGMHAPVASTQRAHDPSTSLATADPTASPLVCDGTGFPIPPPIFHGAVDTARA
jgi:hypothetical protein